MWLVFLIYGPVKTLCLRLLSFNKFLLFFSVASGLFNNQIQIVKTCTKKVPRYQPGDLLINF